MVCLAACAVIRTCVKNVLYGSRPSQNQVQLVPVAWTRLSPGDFMLRFCLEEGVSDAKGVEGTQLKQSLTILIHFPYSKRTKAGGSWIVVCTYSGIKVTQENKLFRDGDGQDCWCKILLELIFCVMSGGNIGGYTLTRANERPSTNQQPTTWRGHSSFAIPIGVDTTREAAVTSYKSLLNWCRAVRHGLLPTVGEGGLLPYISHKGMCSPMGYCFYATSV